MRNKTLSLEKSIFELASEHPDFVEVFASLGFTDITKPGMLNTAGRFMTIPKGAKLKKLNLNEVIIQLEEKGFSVTTKESVR